jgi:hypothetical protein
VESLQLAATSKARYVNCGPLKKLFFSHGSDMFEVPLLWNHIVK